MLFDVVRYTIASRPLVDERLCLLSGEEYARDDARERVVFWLFFDDDEYFHKLGAAIPRLSEPLQARLICYNEMLWLFDNFRFGIEALPQCVSTKFGVFFIRRADWAYVNSPT